MFLHGGWDHIVGNMLFLAIFGKNVEGAFGSLLYLVFYFAGGFAAMMTQTAMTLLFGTAAEARVPELGASGATSVAEMCIGRRIGYSQSCYNSSAVMISSLKWMLSNDRQAAAVGLDQPAWPLRGQVDSKRRSDGRGGTGSRRAKGVAAGPA